MKKVIIKENTSERYDDFGKSRNQSYKISGKNPIEACNEVQRRFYPEPFNMIGKIDDPRHQSYITYSGKTMLGQVYYKGVADIISMQDMTDRFNKPEVVKNNSIHISVAII